MRLCINSSDNTKAPHPLTQRQSSRHLLHNTHHMIGELIEKWKSAKSASPTLEFNNSIKSEFGSENILSCQMSKILENSFCRLRVSAHNLYIEQRQI